MAQDDLADSSKTVHNEIQKLRANFCNGCGIAAVAAGLILPVLKQVQSPDWIGWLAVAALGAAGLSVGLLCHSIARIYILKLKD
ncbi:hypothetical protein [Bradyrhizobium sp. CCBAU 11434]|uniref:hypothetical protein n=1 Tax=Bradyrhizobium sp. CCBAU 11434 TaxID=1630885 RepID=UPI0023061FFC|nr:hypothetical protein [Bradyrhizobium sp. CCBAU 11434]